jgi:hypothetical protein
MQFASTLRFWRYRILLFSLLALTLDQTPAFAQVVSVLPQVRQSSLQLSGSSESEPPEFEPGTLGICRFYNLSGYSAVAADGQLVTLKSYCQEQRNWVWYEEGRFWRRFRDAATPETLAFAQTLDRHQVEAYAQSICPFLEDGGTLPELAEIQADSRLPTEFEQAVTVAAVRTYCRRYRRQL